MASKRLTRSSLAMVGTVAIVATGCGDNGGGEGGEFPDQDLTLLAAAGTGGGLDNATRQLEAAMQAAEVEERMTIENDGDGNGNSARATVANGPSDGHRVLLESNRVILNPLLGTTDIDLDDFTTIAQLTTDDVVWAVQEDSEFEEAQDVIDAVLEDTSSVTFGVGTTPSNNQLNILLPLREEGVSDLREINIVNFLDGGNLNTELLGGRVDVASTGLGEAAPLIESGDVRLLAVSSADPQPDDSPAAGVPSWRELGIDVVVSHWRGVFGPADMPDEAVEWWTSTIEEATETDEWQEAVENIGLQSDFVAGEEFRDLIVEEREAMEPIYREMGLIDE